MSASYTLPASGLLLVSKTKLRNRPTTRARSAAFIHIHNKRIPPCQVEAAVSPNQDLSAYRRNKNRDQPHGPQARRRRHWHSFGRDHDTHDQDLAAAISATFEKRRRQQSPTANIQLGCLRLSVSARPTRRTRTRPPRLMQCRRKAAATSAKKPPGLTVTASNDRCYSCVIQRWSLYACRCLRRPSAGNGFEIAVFKKETDSSANANPMDAVDRKRTIDGLEQFAVFQSVYDIRCYSLHGWLALRLAGTKVALQQRWLSLAGLSLCSRRYSSTPQQLINHW